MNFIYDVILNFNEKYYEFYDWNQTDKITHIRKIPYLYISDKALKEIRDNQVKIDKNIIEKFKNKTEEFKKNKVEPIEYALIITNQNISIALKLNRNGIVTHKSSMLIDEENEVNEIAESKKISEIKYEIQKSKKTEEFKTRKETEIERYITSELNKMSKDKLKYLYLECFNQKEEDIKAILKKIKEETKKNFKETNSKIYKFLKLTSNK